MSSLITIFQLFILGFFVFNIFDNPKDIQIFEYSIIIAGFLLFVFSLYTYGLKEFLQALKTGQRLGGEISQENAFGQQATFSTIACVYVIVFRKKYLFILLLPFIFLLVIASGSKAALLVCMLGAILILLFRFKFSFSFVLVSLGLGVVFLYVFRTTIFSGILSRFQLMLDFFSGKNELDASTKERVTMIELGINFFKNRPLLGYGLNNYRILSVDFLGREVYSHNNYIELLVGVGLIGLILFYISPLYVIIENLKKHEKKELFVVIMLLTIMMFDMFGPSYYSKMFYIAVGVGCATVYFQNNKLGNMWR